MDGIILKLITHSLKKCINPITVKVSTLQPIGGGWSHICFRYLTTSCPIFRSKKKSTKTKFYTIFSERLGTSNCSPHSWGLYLLRNESIIKLSLTWETLFINMKDVLLFWRCLWLQAACRVHHRQILVPVVSAQSLYSWGLKGKRLVITLKINGNKNIWYDCIKHFKKHFTWKKCRYV